MSFFPVQYRNKLCRHNSYDISVYRMIIVTPLLLLTIPRITFTFAQEGKIVQYIIYRNL